MKYRIKYLLKHYPLTLLCLALVWYLSLFIDMPETPMDDVPFIDKWTHLAMYGGTCSVMWIEYLRCHDRLNGWKLFLLAWLGPILMSGLLELLQKYCTTTRQGEWLDFLANSTGVTLAVGIGLMIWKIKGSLSKEK
ncbi:MAG: VanZ family protein [Prevotella sp.]|nr:VanZ family protein [Prevotella sp.]